MAHEDSHEGLPYRLSFDEGIQPTDIAWLHVSQLPIARFEELAGEAMPETTSRFVSMQRTGLGERESALLADVHKAKLEPHISTLERIRKSLVRAGLEEDEAKHLVDVFALGILVGTETAEITEQYAAQGIRDLEGM